MKKILVIPHHPDQTDIKIRLAEVAKALSGKYEVYFLRWRAAFGNYSLTRRILISLRDLFTWPAVYKEGSLNIVRIPLFHRPFFLVLRFNSFWLNRFIGKHKIDAVINGSYYMFSIPGKRSFRYIFDLPDLPEAGEGRFFRLIARQVKSEIAKADAVTAVSNALAGYVRDNYQKECAVVPNGFDSGKIGMFGSDKRGSIRKRLGLEGKWVIGYIGHIGSWVDVKLAVDAFKRVRKDMPDAGLLWIGICPDIQRLKRLYPDKDIIFAGGIDDEHIEPYFKALDLGILPHKKSPFQDMAFHLKVVEYSAAGKFVVSTPLETTKEMGFPNVIFAAENAEAWADAIRNARRMQWKEEWAGLVQDYSWVNIVEKFSAIIGP